MIELTKPYFYAPDHLAGLDFNRQIIEPGVRDDWPDGALGLYVDDNFWCVAALPLEEYRNIPLPEIVKAFWPMYFDQATFTPDHGTIERKAFFYKTEAEAMKKMNDHLQKALIKMREDNERLRRNRSDVSPRSPNRVEKTNNYFIRQYEHLLTAMAHEGIAMDAPLSGVCRVCGLLLSDRVHNKLWLDKKTAGYKTDMEWSGSFPSEYDENGDDDE